MIKIIDKFLAVPLAEVEWANQAEYKDYQIGDQLFPKFALTGCDYRDLQKIEEAVGKKLQFTLQPMYRKYYSGEKQPTFIHSDVNEGEYTVIVFMNKINEHNGLSFWEHESGYDRANKLNYNRVENLTHDEEQWQIYHGVSAKFNRAVVFDSALFHSRWPKENWQIGGDEARLVKVMFLKERK